MAGKATNIRVHAWRHVDLGGGESCIVYHDATDEGEPDGWCAFARDAAGFQVGDQFDFDTKRQAMIWAKAQAKALPGTIEIIEN